MANAKTENVIFCDTSTTTYSGPQKIKSIKYIGNASGTATIKNGSTAGDVIWEESGASNVWNPDVGLRAMNGIYVTLTNSAKLYIYLE